MWRPIDIVGPIDAQRGLEDEVEVGGASSHFVSSLTIAGLRSRDPLRNERIHQPISTLTQARLDPDDMGFLERLERRPKT